MKQIKQCALIATMVLMVILVSIPREAFAVDTTVPVLILISPSDGQTLKTLDVSKIKVRIVDPESEIGLASDSYPSYYDDYTKDSEGQPKYYWLIKISGTLHDGIWQLDTEAAFTISQGWATRTVDGTYNFGFGARNTEITEAGWVSGVYTIDSSFVDINEIFTTQNIAIIAIAIIAIIIVAVYIIKKRK